MAYFLPLIFVGVYYIVLILNYINFLSNNHKDDSFGYIKAQYPIIWEKVFLGGFSIMNPRSTVTWSRIILLIFTGMIIVSITIAGGYWIYQWNNIFSNDIYIKVLGFVVCIIVVIFNYVLFGTIIFLLNRKKTKEIFKRRL